MKKGWQPPCPLCILSSTQRLKAAFGAVDEPPKFEDGLFANEEESTYGHPYLEKVVH